MPRRDRGVKTASVFDVFKKEAELKGTDTLTELENFESEMARIQLSENEEFRKPENVLKYLRGLVRLYNTDFDFPIPMPVEIVDVLEASLTWQIFGGNSSDYAKARAKKEDGTIGIISGKSWSVMATYDEPGDGDCEVSWEDDNG